LKRPFQKLAFAPFSNHPSLSPAIFARWRVQRAAVRRANEIVVNCNSVFTDTVAGFMESETTNETMKGEHHYETT